MLNEKDNFNESDSDSSIKSSLTEDSNSKNLSDHFDSSNNEKSVSSSDDSDDDTSVSSSSTNPTTKTQEGTPPVCDWISEGCKGEKPGSILQLKKCQHHGGKCKKFVHHVCAVNWAYAHLIEEPGNTCREHTTGYRMSTDNAKQNNAKRNIKKPKLPMTSKKNTR